MTNVDLESVRGPIDVYRWIKLRQAELKELETTTRAAIEAAMGDADTGTLDDKPVISWLTYKKRQLNQKALKENLPELAETYTEVKEVRRFELVTDE